MRPSRHVVVMARRPQLGRVKTRLADGLGKEAALSFYSRTLKRLIKRLDRDSCWQVALAVTPASKARRGGLWTRGLPTLAQAQGDLGIRMQAAIDAMPTGPVVLVGSDVPSLKARHIALAFRALEKQDVVFGPSDDGGYWLIGVAAQSRETRLFGPVRWSSPHALEDTMAGLPGDCRVGQLEALSDIDTADDWRRWRSSAKPGYGDGEREG
jgi:uncharacterized protein